MYLTHETKEVGDEIVAAYQARLDFIKSIVADTHATLEEFRTRREQLSGALRELLSKSESLRKKDFNIMMEEILTVQRAREENVKAILEEFKTEEEQILERLQSLVEKGTEVRIKNLKRVLAQLKHQQQAREQDVSLHVNEQVTKMQQEVTDMLEAFKKEREKMTAEWQQLVSLRREGA